MGADLRELNYAMLPVAEELVELARQAGWNPRVTSVKRSSAKQKKLYRKFLRGEMPYTVAIPGTSKHELGIAFDLTVTPHVKGREMHDRLRELGMLWESAGGTWGGSFSPPDPVHFDGRRWFQT